MFETEEAKARQAEQRAQFQKDWQARLSDPELIAERAARAAAERAKEEAARAARSYPVLYPAKKLGFVLAVYDDGRVEIGRMVPAGEGAETFLADNAEEGRVVRLEKTCDVCPEQYDAFIGAQRMGYLRLRHGIFRADYPEHRSHGETVLEGCPRGDGCFDPAERPEWLDRARAALYEAWRADWHDASDEDIAAEVARQREKDDED